MSATSSVVDAAHRPRQRLGSVGDSVPASDSSEGTGSETFELVSHWAMDDHSISHHQDHRQPTSDTHRMHINGERHLEGGGDHLTSEVNLDSLSLENSGVLSELERGQVESFFSGLGTEVSVC